MKTEYNSMYFQNRETALNFIKSLLEADDGDDLHYSDMHVYTEEGAVIIEWIQVPYSGDYGGKFTFIDENQFIETQLYCRDRGEYMYLSEAEDNEDIIIDRYSDGSPSGYHYKE